jgi:Cdc6-like AAA superfamily ATPase
MQCDIAMEAKCPEGHTQRWKCFQKKPLACHKCEDEAMAKAKKLQRDHELEVERDAKQKAYAKKLADIQDEIARERQRLKDNQDDQQREAVLQQHRVDLSSITAAIGRAGSFFSGVLSQPSQSASNIATPPDPSLRKYPAESSSMQNPSPKPNSPLAANPAFTSASPPVTPAGASPSRDQWEDDKKFNGATNEHLDALMDMIGLEEVKKQFLAIKSRVEVVIRQSTDLKDERFGAALLGNPGTGKTTVARLYAKFLASMGVIPGDYFVETTGARLASDGTNGCKKLIEDILNNGGGALFLDEAYQLVSGSSFGGGSVLDFLLAEIENLTGKVVFIIAGYNKQMEDFFAHNPGIPSRIPIQLQFDDYSDADLLKILAQRIQKKYSGRMKIEKGSSGILLRIVTRRLGRGRGKEGFGNARAVHTVFSQIADRQAKRLDRERRSGLKPDDFLFTKEDLIGPEPSVALANDAAWIELQGLIGLAEVKSQVQALLDRIQANYERELQEKPIIECSLNRVFLGSPGTGKTSVAKLYGRILADLGLLSIGEGKNLVLSPRVVIEKSQLPKKRLFLFDSQGADQTENILWLNIIAFSFYVQLLTRQ